MVVAGRLGIPPLQYDHVLRTQSLNPNDKYDNSMMTSPGSTHEVAVNEYSMAVVIPQRIGGSIELVLLDTVSPVTSQVPVCLIPF